MPPHIVRNHANALKNLGATNLRKCILHYCLDAECAQPSRQDYQLQTGLFKSMFRDRFDLCLETDFHRPMPTSLHSSILF